MMQKLPAGICLLSFLSAVGCQPVAKESAVSPESNSLAERCQTAADRGVAYVERYRRDDGAYANFADDLVAYYKTPFVWQYLGRTEQAQRSLEYLFNTFLDDDGDLRKKGEKTTNPVYSKHLDHYMNTWVVRGAVAQDRRPEAIRMLAYLKTQQDQASGGVKTRRDAEQVDVGTTAAFGIAALDADDLLAAVQAGDFLLAALDAQPDADKFYLRFEKGELVTTFSDDDAPFLVIRSADQGQSYWYPGIAMVLLTRLAEDTGKQVYEAGALRYMDFFDRCASDRYGTLASGKLGWGASGLYRRTADRNLFDAAAAVASSLIDLQLREGQWAFSQDPDEPVSAATIDATVELALWSAVLGECVRCD